MALSGVPVPVWICAWIGISKYSPVAMQEVLPFVPSLHLTSQDTFFYDFSGDQNDGLCADKLGTHGESSMYELYIL